MEFVRISPETLSPEALNGLVEEFVSREGTDYGLQEAPFEEKKKAVMEQIARGDAKIVFDPESESCNIVLKEELSDRTRPC